MSRRPPAQVRLFDIFKTVITLLLLLLLIVLLLFRFWWARPAPATAVPTVGITRTANFGQAVTEVPTVTLAPTLLPTTLPTATFTLVFTSTPIPPPTTVPAPTNTLPPLPTLAATSTIVPTRPSTATPVVSGSACPPYGARGQDLGSTYITVYCDTLSNIAERTGVSLEALIRANPQIPDPNLIFSGNVVIIPAPRAEPK